MSRKPKIDREAFPLVYIGPSTPHIETGAALLALRANGKHIRGQSGMLCYTVSTGEGVQLPPSWVVPYEAPRRRRPSLERVREMMRGRPA